MSLLQLKDFLAVDNHFIVRLNPRKTHLQLLMSRDKLEKVIHNRVLLNIALLAQQVDQDVENGFHLFVDQLLREVVIDKALEVQKDRLDNSIFGFLAELALDKVHVLD